MSHSAAVSPDACETHSQRDRIRSHMKMVIQQLEGILTELKDVAKELREVVGQIDKLTADFDFDQEPDDWTVATVSSTSSSERGLGDTFRLDLFTPDVLSDCWDFSGFLEATSPGTTAGPKPPSPSSRPPEESETGAEPATVPAATPYSQMNGGLPIPNGPLVVTPDSSSEEATSSTYSHKTSRTSGTRERVRFSDKILYHALCCDDDDEDEGEEDLSRATPDSELSPPLTSPTPPEHHVLHNCLHSSAPRPPTVRADRGPGTPAPPRKSLLNPGCQKKLLRNSSTQTVSDKSTQTVLPYVPAKHKTKDNR